MNHSLQQFQAQLLRGYQQQAAHYKQALQRVHDLEAALAASQDVDRPLGELAEILKTIAAMNPQMNAWKTRWEQAGRVANPELEALIRHVRQQVATLLEKVRGLEQKADDARRRLVPQLEAKVRARRMQAAYANPYGRSST